MTYLDDDMPDAPSCTATPDEEAQYIEYLQVRAHEEAKREDAKRLATFLNDLTGNSDSNPLPRPIQ